MGSKPIIPSAVTTDASIGSVFNTLNPVSHIIGGDKDYVPKSLINLLRGKPGSAWERNAAPAKMAHLISKVIGGTALLGLGAWGVRSLLHSMKVDALDSDVGASAGHKLNSLYNRPTESAIEQHKNTQAEASDSAGLVKTQNILTDQLGAYSIALGAIPPAAALLALVGSFKQADKHYDRKLGEKLDKQLSYQEQLRDEIGTKRILTARGVSDEDLPEIPKEASMKKQALQGNLVSLLGTGAFLLAAASFMGGYNYQRSRDPNSLKYKAYKKGLQTYNKARIAEQNVQSMPLSPKLTEIFDSNLSKTKRPQDMQSISGNTYRDVLM